MHEDYMLNNAFSVGETDSNSKNLDSLFDNLTEDYDGYTFDSLKTKLAK